MPPTKGKVIDMQTLALIIAIITVIAVILLNRRTKFKPKTPGLKRGKNGCAHRSNKDLNVTAMGDIDEYYLCELCNQKVRRSELNG